MTSILQQMQTSPARASELLAKLLDTAPGAAKTRGRLLSELKSELDRQAEFEEQRLFPVLKEHPETKDLVDGALNDSRRMRELLDEAERSPKDSEDFGARLAELRDMLQRHLRDDSNEILPAIVKALGDEEAGAAGREAEDETAETTPARRAEAGDRRPEDEHEESGAERQAAHVVEAGAEPAHEGETMAPRAMEDWTDTEAERGGRVLSMIAPEARQPREAAFEVDMAPAASSMMALLTEQARHALEVQTMMAAGRARALAELSQVQSAFIVGSVQRMAQFNERYLALMRGWRGLLFVPSSRR